jgi:hypothetical protein
MDMEFSSEQRQLQASLQQLFARYKQLPQGTATAYALSDALEADLIASGYLDIGRTEGLGELEAALLVEAASQLPFCNEVAASALVAPRASSDPLPRPLALARAPLSGPIRYLPVAKAVLVDNGRDVRLLDPAKCVVRTVDSVFAYPIAVFEKADLDAAPVLKGAAPAAMRRTWQLALAAETLGCAQAAIDVTLAYLKERKQFGHAIGSFQALQHRISECVSMLESLRVLVYHAAMTGKPGDAATAAFYAQDSAPRIVLDCQQMHGAMGVTLEYPLHFWTYRMKVLQGELGGSIAQAESMSESLWAA